MSEPAQLRTFPCSTRLTALTRTPVRPSMKSSFLRLFLLSFHDGAERPTEAKAGNGLRFEDRMALLGALEMLSAKLHRNGLLLNEAETATYETALNVIGPIDL